MTRNRFGMIGAAVLILCSTAALSPAQTSGTASLTVRVTGIRSAEGNLRVVLRRDENTVIEVRQVEIDPKTLTAQTVFDKVPEGSYGVAVIHDANKNGKLDYNEMGMPVEGYGHSNNPAKRMGPPNFDETKFNVSKSGTSIEIQLIYWP